tara:strand:- start:1336 stop:1947 length:612 start_codon:yes stop_codon:yes gene_type:complete
VKNRITALIMLGGQSNRIGGGIKSLLKFNNKTIFDRIFEKISPNIDNIILNCNYDTTELLKYKLPIIKDYKKGFLGPLAGIHTGMRWILKNSPETEWLLTVPGDTPFIPKDLISRLEKKISPNSDIILSKSNMKTNPIIGLWKISLYQDLNEHLDLGTRKILSWAELHSIDFINYNFKEYDPFFNINTKEDLKLAELIEKELF